jgi:hypothetical protein
MILNLVRLIWEERNSGRYEYARACRERARAPRAPKKNHQPSAAINFQWICSAADPRPPAKSGNIGIFNVELTLESCV